MELFSGWRNAGCAPERRASMRIFFWVMTLLCVLVVVVGAQTFTCVKIHRPVYWKDKSQMLINWGPTSDYKTRKQIGRNTHHEVMKWKKNFKRSNLKFPSHSFTLSFKIFFSSKYLIRGVSSLFSNFFLFYWTYSLRKKKSPPPKCSDCCIVLEFCRIDYFFL